RQGVDNNAGARPHHEQARNPSAPAMQRKGRTERGDRKAGGQAPRTVRVVETRRGQQGHDPELKPAGKEECSADRNRLAVNTPLAEKDREERQREEEEGERAEREA